jgi:hypothetical protein
MYSFLDIVYSIFVIAFYEGFTMLSKISRFAALGVVASLSLTGCSHTSAHHAFHAHEQTPAPNPTSGPQSTTYKVNDDGSAWKQSPYIHKFYETTVATFAHGNNVDVDAYEKTSFGIFREFARANRVSEDAMLDHLKLIPRQVVGIVKDDPKVLKSYDNFWTALVGPE